MKGTASRSCFMIFIALFSSTGAIAQSQRDVIQECPRLFDEKVKEQKDVLDHLVKYIDDAHAAIFYPEAARNLISATLGTADPGLKADAKDFYCIIHVLRWADPSLDKETNTQKQTVQAQNWYVYHGGKWSQEDFTSRKRLFGVHRLWLLYVHLNKDPSLKYEVRYEFDITRKAPSNLKNLFALAQLFLSGKVKETLLAVERPPVWGGRYINVEYSTSDITITPRMVVITEGDCTSSSRVAAGAGVGVGDPETFDNEGRHWWDVSVGVPIRRISQLDLDSTANTVTAKKVDKQNIYALLNLFVPPKDLKISGSSLVPHFVGGISIAKQPLHRFMIGAGWGPAFAHFYIGALWVRQEELTRLKPGDTGTPSQLAADLRHRYKAQVTFGINLPVRGILETMKKTGK